MPEATWLRRGGDGGSFPRRRENEDGHMSDWTAFGRVDADGTVYVKTTEGERVVGSWQAGAPEEGLAHFARRFADLDMDILVSGAEVVVWKLFLRHFGSDLHKDRRLRVKKSLTDDSVGG